MRIAILEDNCSDRLLLTEQIHTYMSTHHLEYIITEFDRAEDFVESVYLHSYSIVFMDIYLTDQMTGIDAAKALRKKDKDCKIIFLTSSSEFALQGYSVNASHYLIKPITYAKFLEAMENCSLHQEYAVPFLDLSPYGGPPNLETKRIISINLHGRTVHIKTSQQTFTVTSAFSRLTEPLSADPRFLLCIQGVMVNMDYISDYEDSVFVLKTGDRIPINMRNRKRILQQYRNYMFENIGGSL